jgi:hypothetical protein
MATKKNNPAQQKQPISNPQPAAKTKTEPVVPETEKPLMKVAGKMLLLVALVAGVICYLDRKGYFNPDDSNNHTLKKWDAIYELSEENDIDVLLIGNSHMYSGINPEHLSNKLGATAFIIASPGTTIGDSYYSLVEALKICRPKAVVVETYGISKIEQLNMEPASLSNQFQSFSARRNLTTKLLSTPHLFNSDNYLYAWSNTLRNHDFIFTNTNQLAINRELIKLEEDKTEWDIKKKLYLGRFVRFTSGLEDSSLLKYEKKGAPVDGKEFTYSESSEYYTQQIIELCEAEGIPVVFLTLPMYEKHVKNYPYWKKQIAGILGSKYAASDKWLDMQAAPIIKNFTPDCFENTFETNQHMTYDGSVLASGWLADFLRENLPGAIPDRHNEAKWTNLFYGADGYFYYTRPRADDLTNKLIASNQQLDNVKVTEVIVTPINENASTIIAKIGRDQLKKLNLEKSQLKLVVRNAKDETFVLDLVYDRIRPHKDYYIFTQTIMPIAIKDVVQGAVVFAQAG